MSFKTVKNKFKIVKITDHDGIEKTDEATVNRVGRVMIVNPDELVIGKRATIECAFPGYWKSIVTTAVLSYTEYDDTFILKTENSYYHFKRV